MLKLKSTICGAIAALLLTSGVHAATITDNLGEFNFTGSSPFPSAVQIVGTFMFDIPAGDTILSASLTGTFGNSVNTSSSPFDIFGDGVFIGQCTAPAPCFTDGLDPFDFSVLNLADLADGELVLTVVQTNPFAIRLGATVLTINTLNDPVSAVPLPAALPLFASTLVGLSLMSRRRKSKIT